MKSKIKINLPVFFFLLWNTIPISAQTEFFGMTQQGGKYGNGTIFRVDENWENTSIISEFTSNGIAYYPVGPLCKAGNGKIYGVTYGGGNHVDDFYQGDGAIFEWDPVTRKYSEMFLFDGDSSGRSPCGTMIQASNGKLYGTTCYGGLYDCGVLYEWDPVTNLFLKKLDFKDEIGKNPYGSLVEAENGKLYGTTIHGGISNEGVVFEWDPATDAFDKKHDFIGSDGRQPLSALTPVTGGKLYGTTEYGGDFDYGVIFVLSIGNSAFRKIFDFRGDDNGRMPEQSLLLADNGKLYGTAFGGMCCGVLFELDTADYTYTKKHDFNGNDGAGKISTLFQAENGKLYGTTTVGGQSNWGVIFEWDPVNETCTNIYNFNKESEGISPGTSFIQSSPGKLIGVAQGGYFNKGVIFEWDYMAHTSTKEYDFSTADNGRYPGGNLVQAHNGKLYGMTSQGGLNDKGVIFELDPIRGIYTKKFDFKVDENGKWPMGSLVQANNGKLYGMAGAGGYADSSDFGVLFEWDPENDSFSKKLIFGGEGNGRFPTGSLVLADNGKLYGMTSDGGIYQHEIHSLKFGNGVLFEWDPSTDTYIKKLDFNETENGRSPYGSLTKAGDSNLYGVTSKGGQYGHGVLFEWDPDSNVFTKLYEFVDAESGINPYGTLLDAGHDTLLYGVASGGDYDRGILYEYNRSTNTFKKDFDFKADDPGYSPCGTLVQGDNGKVYGMTRQGGSDGKGAFFEWDPVKDTMIFKFNIPVKENSLNRFHAKALKDKNNAVPQEEEEFKPEGGILRVGRLPEKTIAAMNCSDFLSPSGRYIWTQSGIYADTILNLTGMDTILTVDLTIGPVDTAVTIGQNVLTAHATEASYQWIRCNDPNTVIEGAVDRTYTPAESGCYAVIIRQFGCVDTSACHAFSNPTRISNTFRNSVVLYPNPHSGTFKIDLGRTYQALDVAVTELDGRVIQQRHFSDSRLLDMNICVLPGIYLVVIRSENEKAIFKTTKE